MEVIPEITDEMVYSTGAQWHVALRMLSGTMWTRTDLARVALMHPVPLIDALRLARRTTGCHDGAVAAVRAAYTKYDTTLISPLRMVEVVRNFIGWFDISDNPLQDYVETMTTGHPPNWLGVLGEGAPKGSFLQNGVIWVNDPDIPGVWIFRSSD